MNYIQLKNNKRAIVDNEDYKYLNQWKWCDNGDGHVMRVDLTGKKRKKIWLYRVIINAPHDMEVDHINHDPLDNRKENLRICTRSQNIANQKVRRDSQSGIRGIWWNDKRRKWQVNITVNRKQYYLGSFDNKIDASNAYKIKAKQVFGEFAYQQL